MTRLERPENWQDLAAGYVLDNLSEDEEKVWDTLLKQHPELAEEAEAFLETFNEFAEGVPMHSPSEQVLKRIRAVAEVDLETTATVPDQPLQSIALERNGGSSSASQVVSPTVSRKETRYRSEPSAIQNWRRLTQVGGAIALGLITLLGIQLYSTRSQLQQANRQLQEVDAQREMLAQELQQVQAQAQAIQPVVQTLRQPESLIYRLEGSKLANTASGRLVVSDQQDVIIVVKNLPELPKEEVYRLWAAFPSDAGTIYCGQFNSNTEGIIQFTPSSNQCGANPTQMLITLDGITDPITSAGPVVMQSNI